MSRRTLGLFVATAFLFGTSFIGIEAGLTTLPPVLFAAFRVDIAAVVLLAYAWARYDDWLPQNRADLWGLVASTVFIVFANNVLLFVGQTTTSGSAGAIVYGIMPVLAPVFAFFVLRDVDLSVTDVVGLLLGLVGVVVIVQPDPANLLGSSGQALVALAAGSVALGSVLLRRFRPTMPTLALTGWSMALAAPTVHVTSLGLGEAFTTVVWTPAVIAAVLYVGLLGTAAAYPAYYALIGAAGPVHANLIAYAMPVVAAVTGWALLGETVTLSTLFGFVVVFVGFAVVQRESFVAELRRVARDRFPDADVGAIDDTPTLGFESADD